MNQASNITKHLWAGQLGNGFVVLSFVAAFLSCIAYYLAYKDSTYKKLARISFNIHSFAVLGIIATMFYMLVNHYFDYQYVWQHSNTSMDMKYILSCFWEGQEGSFLLWTFWNIVLGQVLKHQLKTTEWEVPVMAIFALVQVFLASMLLGVYISDALLLVGIDVENYKLGTNPFLLLTEHADYKDLPFVKGVIKDGRGLNPLLMNYWMTIHPPTLFLGFSSTLVPFAFAIAAMWNKKYNDWQKLALPWTYFGILILGVGILMGGAWAYEALSFGGFWAWDPVENSSLVPWLVLVAAGHTMIINKNKGGSLFTTHLLAIASFLLVLYSTFLTRSGILGNASVHAFTDLGMTGQLVLYVLTFIFISVALLINNKLYQISYILFSFLLFYFGIRFDVKKILILSWIIISFIATVSSYFYYFPREKDEEENYSREFWMFLGALLLLKSSLIITYFTSMPVINKLFGSQFAPPKVPVYNTWMVPFAIAIIFLIGASQYLKYKKTNSKDFFKQVMRPLLLSLLFGLACCVPLYFLNGFADSKNKWDLISYALLFTTSLFAVFANADYWLRVLKGKIRKSGASVAHIGFALILLGALISTSKKVTLSKNTSSRKLSSLGAEFDDQKSILLTQGDTLPMGPYYISYKKKRREGIDVYFDVDYFKLNKENKLEYDFTLTPHVQDNPRMGKAPEPDTKHYLNKDIYTHVVYADLNVDTVKANKDKFGTEKNFIGHLHDTIFSSNAIIIFDTIRSDLSKEEFERDGSHLEITLVLKAKTTDNKIYYAYPKYIIQNNTVIPKDSEIKELGLNFAFWKINPEENTMEVIVREKLSNEKDFIIMEAHVFPYINILWLGCLLMAFGTIIAIVERVRLLKLIKVKNNAQ